MDYKKIAAEIIENVGGEENVKSVSHCMTRLRLVLIDESQVNKEKVEEISGVLGTAFGAGQFQVILGQNLNQVFEMVMQNFSFEGSTVEGKKKVEKLTVKGLFKQVVDYMSGAVKPGYFWFDGRRND